jgi:anti-sigma-K factor RskA
MSLPHKSGPLDDRQIVRYLLGLLPAEEAERLDEASIADDDFAARLRISEADLVDSYVRGKLEAETLKRFESHYLSSPRRRKNVKFAASLVRAIDRAAPPGTQGQESSALVSSNEPNDAQQAGASSDGQVGTRSKVALRLMLAAAVLLAASGLLLLQTVRLGTGPNATERAGDVATGDAPGRESVSALALLPQTRAAGSIPVIAVSPATDRVTFQLRLESNDFQQYEVGLEDPASNQVVWRSDAISAETTGQTRTLSVIVPARVLKPQHYSLTVMGRGARHAEVVGSYAFQVAHR